MISNWDWHYTLIVSYGRAIIIQVLNVILSVELDEPRE